MPGTSPGWSRVLEAGTASATYLFKYFIKDIKSNRMRICGDPGCPAGFSEAQGPLGPLGCKTFLDSLPKWIVWENHSEPQARDRGHSGCHPDGNPKVPARHPHWTTTPPRRHKQALLNGLFISQHIRQWANWVSCAIRWVPPAASGKVHASNIYQAPVLLAKWTTVWVWWKPSVTW